MAYVIWLTIWMRPFFKCPLCKGKGGAMVGYYEPEWSECKCWKSWEPFENRGISWFIGRLPLLQYLRAKATIRFLKMDTILPLNVIARCRMGLHPWSDEEIEPNRRICCACFTAERKSN